MSGETTYKDLFQLVEERLDKRQQYQGTKRFRNQLDRTDIGPIFNNPISDVRASEIVASVQELLNEALPEFITEGLEVTATDPVSGRVNVTAGKGSKGGTLFILPDDVTVDIPFDLTTEVFYLALFRDRLMIIKEERENTLTIAKIIVPFPGQAYRIYDRKDDREDEREAYIIGNKPVSLKVDAYGRLEEDSIEFLRDNIGPVLADNIIGNIRLSENLKITNTQGTLELDSNSIRLYDTSENVLAKFNKDGTFYYDTTGKELARFSVSGARVGNIVVTPTTIQSGNYVSGSLGAGFQINDAGDAEFNNIRARGKLTATTFEKDTVSVIGGNLLVMDGDILDADMTSLDASTLKISGDTTFAVGDILRIKDGVEDEWLTVSAVNGTVYTVTRDRAGLYTADLNPAWSKGTSVVNYGQSGEGGIFLTSSESNSPYISIITHAGAPWTTTTTHARFGNLNGFLGYVTDAYGIAIGDADDYMTYDPVNGLQIKGSITITGGDIPPKTFYQDTEPSSGDDINEGDYWVDTNDSNKLYIYNTGVWVEISASSSSGGITTFSQGSATSGEGIPVAIAEGDVWYDTDTNKLYRAASAGADAITVGEWVVLPTAGTDDNGNLTTSVLPACDIGTPSGAGLYLGADYMGYYSASCWQSYIKNDGTFLFKGDNDNMVYWTGAVMCVRGLLNADDMTVGSLCADRIGAGQIFLDAGIQITSNETESGNLSRTILDSTGIKSYDTDGCLRLCICRGDMYAETLRLQDPDCTSCYSYLDGGALQFHDEMGAVPYVKRLASGTACAGDTICVSGYKNQPEVIVSVKSLKSYNKDFSAQDQQWNVYADSFAFYCNSGLDYGYCFDVHARLELTAATAAECIKSSGFGGSNCIYTLANTCCSTIISKFNYYCHGAAPSNWCYGCVCYKYCYRCSGCGVWCNTSDLVFEQPHANTTQMQTTYCCSHTICFGASSGPSGCWEILPVIVCVNWVDSGIASGSSTCSLSTRAIGAGLVCRCVCLCTTSSTTVCCALCCVDALSLAGSDPSGTIYCTYVCYCWCSVSTRHLCVRNCSTSNGTSNQICSEARVCIDTNFGVAIDTCAIDHSEVDDFAYSCNCQICWTSTARFSDMTTYNACSWTGIDLCSFVFSRVNEHGGSGCVWTEGSLCVCFLGGNLYQCYCTTSGDAEACTFCCLHSTCDVLSSACVLDSAGVLNWMAISYG